MDLIIATSPIIQENFIDKAISSISHIPFSKRFIICDGLPEENAKPEIIEKYSEYKKRLKNDYPDYCVVESKDHRWFIGGIRDILEKCNSEWLFCIQHDVIAPYLCDPYKILEQKPDDAKILFYPHKKLECPTHWFKMITDCGDFQKTNSFCERVFFFEAEHMRKLLKKYNHPKFIDIIGYNQSKRKNTDLNELCKIWRGYSIKGEIHRHLVGKTLR